jgi:hypothetical protein
MSAPNEIPRTTGSSSATVSGAGCNNSQSSASRVIEITEGASAIDATMDARKKTLELRKIAQKDIEHADGQTKMWTETRRLLTKRLEGYNRILSASDAEHEDQPGPSIANYINYMERPFDWSPQLKTHLNRVFHFTDFRLCQEGCVTTH